MDDDAPAGVRRSPLPPGDRAPEFTLPAPMPVREASAALGRLDGFEATVTDRADAAQPFIEMLGQFLLDRKGTIRWTSIECEREGVAGLGKFPTAGALPAAVRALPR